MSEVQLFSTAIKLIIERKTSPEKAFDIAVKSLNHKVNRRKLFNKFLRVLWNYYYATFLYPERDIEDIISVSLNSDFPFKPPKWAEERLQSIMGDLNVRTRQQWIRVNTLKADVEDVRRKLERKGVVLQKDSFEFLFRVIKTKGRISDLEEFKNGEILIQDKASVYSIIFLDPKPNEKILEIGCAPGIKTSLIQQITNNKSLVIGIDISSKRIKVQQDLMNKLGVENVELVIGDGSNVPITKADKVLIDAPCTNSGTFVADPSIFLRITKKDLMRLSRLQRNILWNIRKFKVPTVFSTCSLFPEEGEKIAEKYEAFLTPISIDTTNYGYKRSKVWKRVVRFYPNIHGTEGFFIAKFNFSKNITLDDQN
ncbi:Fmu (Sun) domain-containing protein [Sulfolobus acidocaldarius SUSAZ]|nr:Fmu (Sun) domain-containing protein [Sulfolobus acidocaldarius SUSAZ]